MGKAWLFVVSGSTDLYNGTETADLHENGLTAFGIDTQFVHLAALDRLAFQRLVHFPVKFIVETADHLRPALLAHRNFIELLFDRRGEIVIHDGRELRIEKIGHDHADIGRRKFVFFFAYGFGKRLARDLAFGKRQLRVAALLSVTALLNHVSARNDRRNGRCIGRRAPDTELLEPFDQ